MNNIIDEIKDDILNGGELQYDYEIDGVSITVLMDYSDTEIQIIATDEDGISHTWETEKWAFDEVIYDLEDFIRDSESYATKEAIRRAINDCGVRQDDGNCQVCAIADDRETTIYYYNCASFEMTPHTTPIVSVTVRNSDLEDDEDGVIEKIADFFIRYY